MTRIMCPSGSLKKNYFLGASLAGAAGAASFFASAAGAADAAADAAGAAASDATGAAAGAGATTGAGAGAGAGGSAGLLQAANAKAAAIAEKAKSLFIFDNQSELMKGLVNLPKQHAAQTRLEIKIVSRLTFDCTIAKL